MCFPPCKINLGLRVLRRRPDGFHEVQTCFYPVPWTDILEIVPAASFSFVQTGLPTLSAPSENLCVLAYKALSADFTLSPVAIHLHKLIPMGAGLGGGSSDGASTLIILNELFSLGLSRKRLLGYAARLGSDCPFFVAATPQLATGRGEVLADFNINLAGKFLVIVKPEINVVTAEAYSWIKPYEGGEPLEDILKLPIREWKDKLVNDFEPPVFERFPVLAEVKATMYQMGALYASMSGSGSAVFGLFDKEVSLHHEWEHLSHWADYL